MNITEEGISGRAAVCVNLVRVWNQYDDPDRLGGEEERMVLRFISEKEDHEKTPHRDPKL